MPQPILLLNATHVALPAPAPVRDPLGKPVSNTSTHAVEGPEGLLTGIWECTPGKWRRQVLSREFSHFIAGHCIFTPDGGEPVELQGGDAVFFPANCEGVWDVRETVRKSFVIIP